MSEETEKSLLEIWAKSFPRLRPNRLNRWLSVSGVLLGLLPLVFGPIADFLRIAIEIADLFSQVFGGILGFIIAGFAIASTAIDKTLVIKMWRHSENYSKLPLFRVHMLQYLKPLIYCFLGLMISLCLSLVLRFAPTIAEQFAYCANPTFRITVQASLVALFGGLISVVLVQLKAFIFNLYRFALTQVEFLSDTSDP